MIKSWKNLLLRGVLYYDPRILGSDNFTVDFKGYKLPHIGVNEKEMSRNYSKFVIYVTP